MFSPEQLGSQTTTATSRFMRLPAGLHVRVYEELFADIRHDLARTLTSILRVSRQIHEEAMHVLYTAEFFDIRIHSTGISYGSFRDVANKFRPEHEGQISPLVSRARRRDIRTYAQRSSPP